MKLTVYLAKYTQVFIELICNYISTAVKDTGIGSSDVCWRLYEPGRGMPKEGLVGLRVKSRGRYERPCPMKMFRIKMTGV